MKIFTATRVAALAVGLTLVGSQAFAADPQDGRGRNDNDNTPQQQGPNDQNDRHGRTDSNMPSDQTGPAVRVDQSNDRPAAGTQNRGARVDMSRWHRNFNAPRQYHAGTYRAPHGYSYRHYGYGERLPADYYARDFWLADFLTYGLLAPPSGYVWVRYGPDALLIDEETGEIVQVEYNVFYS